MKRWEQGYVYAGTGLRVCLTESSAGRRGSCEAPAKLLEFDVWLIWYGKLGPQISYKEGRLRRAPELFQYGRGGINTNGGAGEMSKQDPLEEQGPAPALRLDGKQSSGGVPSS